MKGMKNKCKDINLNTEWLGLSLRNPIVLGSLTLISHARIKEQVEFYLKAEEYGVGAIVLESLIPHEFGEKDIKYVMNDIKMFKNELNNTNEDEMGFALLGAPYPNISSIDYGINLLKELKKKIKIPIICSLVNLGDEESIIESAIKLEEAGTDAIELNFSCPNIVLPINKHSTKILDTIPFSLELVDKIKQKLNIGISVKVEPNSKCLELLNEDKGKTITSLTYANAYVGLYPPSLKYPFGGCFGEEKEWAFSGIYGSFNRLVTYKEVAMLKRQFNNVEVSAVGGIVNKKHPLEAILVGADTVQLASGIMWKGLNLIKESVNTIEDFMYENNFKSISDFRGISLKYIKDRVDNTEKYKLSKIQNNIIKRSSMEITEKCIRCKRCLYSGCLALKEKIDGQVYIDQQLCSMCGWCKQKCKIEGAIIIKQ